VIFDAEDDTELMYATVAQRSVEAALDGYNSTFFAYGQTGSGKTWTLFGDGEKSPGITTLAIKALFDAARARAADFLVRMSYLELYNEKLKDLLGEDPTAPSEVLRIIDDPMLGTVVHGANEINVTDVAEALELIDHGEAHRAFGSTSMNAHSSRSHVILTMVIECCSHDAGAHGTTVSRFHLVDLAGSERASNTGAKGATLREGAAINKSLSTLSQVIKALSKGKGRALAHVPFRNSKLTRMLQSSLGGNARTTVVCCASPAASNREQTRSTLAFAASAAKVSSKATRNRVHDKDSLLATYRKEIKRLRHQLEGSAMGELQAQLATVEAENEAMRMKMGGGGGGDGGDGGDGDGGDGGGGESKEASDGARASSDAHEGCVASQLQSLEMTHAENAATAGVGGPALDKHSLAMEKRLRVEAEADAAALRAQLRQWTSEARELGVLGLLTPVSEGIGREDARARRKEQAKRWAKDGAMVACLSRSLDMLGGPRVFFAAADVNGDRVLSARELHDSLTHASTDTRDACTLRDCARIAAAAGPRGLTLGNLLRVLGGALHLPDEGTLEKPKRRHAQSALVSPSPTRSTYGGGRGIYGSDLRRDAGSDGEDPPPPPPPGDVYDEDGAYADEAGGSVAPPEDAYGYGDVASKAQEQRLKPRQLLSQPSRSIHGFVEAEAKVAFDSAKEDDGVSREEAEAAAQRGKAKRAAIEEKNKIAALERKERREAIERRLAEARAKEVSRLASRKPRRKKKEMRASEQDEMRSILKETAAGTKTAARRAIEGRERRRQIELRNAERAKERKAKREKDNDRKHQVESGDARSRISALSGSQAAASEVGGGGEEDSEKKKTNASVQGRKPSATVLSSGRRKRSAKAHGKSTPTSSARKGDVSGAKGGGKTTGRRSAASRAKAAGGAKTTGRRSTAASAKVVGGAKTTGRRSAAARASKAAADGSSSDDDDLMAEFNATAGAVESSLSKERGAHTPAVAKTEPLAGADAATADAAPAVEEDAAPAAEDEAERAPAPAAAKKKKKKKKGFFGLF
jgi:hypothetical protein